MTGLYDQIVMDLLEEPTKLDSSLEETLIKPPIGLVPEYIWKLERLAAIEAAMDRFTKAEKPVPIEWMNEHIKLTGELDTATRAYYIPKVE